MSLDPNKTYLVWNSTEFPNSSSAKFKAPAGSTIDWGDGTVETFDTASTTVNTHTYTDGKTEHTIAISGLTSIDNEAFLGCSGLTRVTIPDSVTTIYNAAFGSCISLTSITFGENSQLTSISSNTFNSCTSLKNIIIPDSVTRIGNYAFWYCISLKNIIIPDSVTSISMYAFGRCDSLTSVTIPDSVTSIGESVFIDCSKLKQLILFPSTPPTLGSGAIPSNIQSIYVQQSSKSAYKNATNWTAFSDKIESNNIYLSFVRFNQKNKEYINEYWNDFNLENGTGDVLIKTTDTNQSFKVMTDGRAKVYGAPIENDDVVRKADLANVGGEQTHLIECYGDGTLANSSDWNLLLTEPDKCVIKLEVVDNYAYCYKASLNIWGDNLGVWVGIVADKIYYAQITEPETNLSIQTTYIPQKLYKHTIYVESSYESSHYTCLFDIINNNSTPYNDITTLTNTYIGRMNDGLTEFGTVVISFNTSTNKIIVRGVVMIDNITYFSQSMDIDYFMDTITEL